MKILLKILGTLFALILLVAGGWIFATLHYTYSSGERAGYIQKISKKGWICKTWEGELAMANLPGAMPQIFTFTVRDDEVAHQIEQHAGQPVSLSYEQHPGIPSTCFGDTEYFVVKLTPVELSKGPVPMPPPGMPAQPGTAPATPSAPTSPPPATPAPAAPAAPATPPPAPSN
jgi:hypothetical protein